jgi:ubiquinone/menaquinone biosynthesis C-methylase UbiE
MNSKTEIGINSKNEWDDKWVGIFDHYQQDTRHAFYINAILNDEDKKILELGAGSFRDMAQLNNFGIDCWGTDYSITAVNLAKQRFTSLAEKIFLADAFKFDNIADKTFDVSFHNGLWVLYNNDADIIKLAKEQSRITKNKIIATVHNAHNSDFVNYFKQLSEKDPLYKIRFFEVEEITNLMLNVCKSVEIIPVGKGKKYYEDELIQKNEGTKENLSKLFKEAGLSHLKISERLLCIGHL